MIQIIIAQMNPSDKLSFVFHNSCHTNSYEAPSAKGTEARRKVTLYFFGKFAAEYLRTGKFYACSARLQPCSGYSGPERLRFFLYRIMGLQTEGFSVIVSFPEASALICNCCPECRGAHRSCDDGCHHKSHSYEEKQLLYVRMRPA